MEIINLVNRKEVEVQINGKDCVMSLALKNISHFQEANKIGLQQALEKMDRGNYELVLKLIYSMVSDKKTGKILGAKFFKDFDEISIVDALSPMVEELLTKDMPQAKNESEKK